MSSLQKIVLFHCGCYTGEKMCVFCTPDVVILFPWFCETYMAANGQ